MCSRRDLFIGGTYLARRDESDGQDIVCRPIQDVVRTVQEIIPLARAIKKASEKIPWIP